MDKNTINFIDVCRICANKIKDKTRQRHLFNYMRGKLCKNLKLITGVRLYDNDGMPVFMCERCDSELNLAIRFRERCIFSQSYLKDMIDKERLEDQVAKNEQHLSEDLIDNDCLEDSDEFEFLEEIASENMKNCCENSDVEEVADTVNVEDLLSNDLPNAGKRHLVLLKDNRPTKRVRNFFICEECGGFFNEENAYHEHLESHAKQKESKNFFPCTFCRSIFKTKTALHQHNREKHDGGRLFKCGTCDETFLGHSAKQRHEIAHLNERPYPCLECDASFSTVKELRCHSTTHALHKFRCDACDKEFASCKLLDIHLNTKTHKRKMLQVNEYAEDEEALLL